MFLSKAIIYNRYNSFEYLYKLFPDDNSYDKKDNDFYSVNLISLACSLANKKIVKFLLKMKKEGKYIYLSKYICDQMHIATVFSGDLDFIQYIFDFRFDIDFLSGITMDQLNILYDFKYYDYHCDDESEFNILDIAARKSYEVFEYILNIYL